MLFLHRPSIEPTLFKFSFKEIFTRVELIPIIFVFFSVDMFDSIGTLTATGHEADLLEDGKLSKARQALLTDAVGTVGGACLGTSTVTCYIESASGIAEGGRTGLNNSGRRFTHALSTVLLGLSLVLLVIPYM